MYFVSTYFAVFLLLVVFDKGIPTQTKQSKWRPMVTVAIPAFNEEQTIEATVKSVFDLHYPKDKIEVIVVDDGSTDGTPAILRKIATTHPDRLFRVIRHDVNKSKGASVNHALREAKGEIFVCLDADSFVKPDALLKMLPHFEEDDNVASVLPFMKITKTNSIILKIQWVEYLMNFFLKKISSLIDCIHVTPGPFGCYRREVLLKVGGFDENNLTEDLEMALRLQKYHYRIIQLLDAEVITVPPDTLKGFYKQRNRWYKGTLHNLHRHRSLIFNKNYGDFGLFHLPMVLGAALLSISFAFLIVYARFLKPLLSRLYDLSYINFDLPLLIKVGSQRFNILDFNYTMLYMTILIFVFALIWIIGSHRYSRESYVAKGLVPSLLFLSIYPVILSSVWLGVVFDLVRGKRQKW
jgi:cellulose synthase/poly-beta-1,6-N-acetylglucosamine synthase-like glycosyltransferase